MNPNSIKLVCLLLAISMTMVCVIAITGGIQSHQERLALVSTSQTESQQVMENVKIIQSSPDSQANYMIETSRLIFYPERRVKFIEAPEFRVQRSNGRILEGSAEHALLIEQSSRLELTGEVQFFDHNERSQNLVMVATSDRAVINLGRFD